MGAYKLSGGGSFLAASAWMKFQALLSAEELQTN
jgi:hypothetical protein